MCNGQAVSKLSNVMFTGFQQIFAPAFYKQELGISVPARSVMETFLRGAASNGQADRSRRQRSIVEHGGARRLPESDQQ